MKEVVHIMKILVFSTIIVYGLVQCVYMLQRVHQMIEVGAVVAEEGQGLEVCLVWNPLPTFQ